MYLNISRNNYVQLTRQITQEPRDTRHNRKSMVSAKLPLRDEEKAQTLQ